MLLARVIVSRAVGVTMVLHTHGDDCVVALLLVVSQQCADTCGY